jgi:hypothetical protein
MVAFANVGLIILATLSDSFIVGPLIGAVIANLLTILRVRFHAF